MADLSITAGSVQTGTHATKKQGVAGTTLTAGQLVYLDTNSKLLLSDANGSAATKVVDGITLDGGALNQPVLYCTLDPDLVVGATIVPGMTYVLSDTPGGIAPVADGITGDTTIVVGVAKSTTVLNFSPQAGGVKP